MYTITLSEEEQSAIQDILIYLLYPEPGGYPTVRILANELELDEANIETLKLLAQKVVQSKM